MKYKKLNEVLSYEQPTKYLVDSTEYKDEYHIPVLTAGQTFILGYTNEKYNIFPKEKLPVIIFDDFTTATKFVDFPFKVKSTAMKILHPMPNINIKYIYYAMQTLKFDSSMHKRYWIVSYSNLEVPIPELEVQKEIAFKLDKVQKTIDIRKKQIEELDKLIKSQFVEMFGDRYTNDCNWECKQLNEVVQFRNGKAHEQVVDENGQYILITSKAISTNMENCRKTNKMLMPLKKNDIVMVMSDLPNGKALAKCWLISEDNKYTLNQRICVFNNYGFNPIFFYYLLDRNEYFLNFDDGNGQTNLRKEDILRCPIIVPPIELQNQFAEFAKQIDKQKFELRKSLEELQKLQESLINKYFYR